MKNIAVIFANGSVSSAVGKNKTEAKKIFNNYYGYKPPKDSYFAEVEMQFENSKDDSTCSMRWVEKEDLSIWCNEGQSVSEMLSIAAERD